MMIAKEICIEKYQQATAVDVEERKDVINLLDYYSLAEIFTLLPIPERIALEEVCLKWNKACKLAWRDIKKYKCNISIGRSYDNCLLTQSYVTKILLNCGIYLEELSLSHVCNSRIMPIVANRCKNLTFFECEFEEASFIQEKNCMVQAFSKLDKLEIIKLHINNNDYGSIINLFDIINSLPEEIKEFHLFTNNGSCKKKYFNFTLKKFKNLQKLTLQGHGVDNFIHEIAKKTKLVYLDINLNELPKDFFPFNQLVNLEHINISSRVTRRTNNLTTDILDSIFSTCKKLKYLDLPYGLYDVDKIPAESWANCKYLEHLGINFHTMSVKLETKFVKYCKNLKYLRLEYMNHMFSEMVSKKLTKLKNLEFLILPSNITLSDKTIIAISKNCKKLKHLKMPHCSLVQSNNGESLSSTSILDELSKLQYLEHLNLKHVENLQDSTIISIANNCKYLKYLNILYCITITETGLMALTSLENLQELKVNFLDITDNVIVKLKGLKKFYCAGCKKLTDAGVIQFIHNNPDLEDLDICFIPNITVDTVIAADQATKNRVNGVILYIHFYYEDIEEAFELIIKSQWLVLKDH